MGVEVGVVVVVVDDGLVPAQRLRRLELVVVGVGG